MITIEFDGKTDPIPLIQEYIKQNKYSKIIVYGESNPSKSEDKIHDILVELGIPDGCTGIKVIKEIVEKREKPRFLINFYKGKEEEYNASCFSIRESVTYSVKVAKTKKTFLFKELFGDADVNTNVFIEKVIEYVREKENESED